MRKKLRKHIITGVLITSIGAGLMPAAYAETSHQPHNAKTNYAQQLSANIPLNSYIYDYLDKLDGLGYIEDMRIGAKPYTRMQAARWLQQINYGVKHRADLPEYVQAMLQQLNEEFRGELAVLSGKADAPKIDLREVALGATYYDGQTVNQQPSTASTYQPLNVNNDGYRFAQKLNETMTMRIEGKPKDNLVVSLTPRFSYDDDSKADADIQAGYIKTNINNVQIQVGKDAMWWGQGEHGSLLLTNNATPQRAIKLSNIEPVKMHGLLKFLGQSDTTVFYSILEKDRSDIPYPSFFGVRKDFTPSENFTFGMARTSMMGGKGHMLSAGDYWDFLTGENATTRSADKWNSIAGFDFSWRLPQLNGLQVYGELYGEDQAKALGIIPTPSKNAGLLGVYIPRVSRTGDWDAQIEWAHTSDWWYGHWVYQNGYTYKGDIMGDAMGHDASRYYIKFTHYRPAGNTIALNAEHVVLEQGSAASPKIDSVWVSMRKGLEQDLFLDATVGAAKVKIDGDTEHNYLTSVRVTKRY